MVLILSTGLVGLASIMDATTNYGGNPLAALVGLLGGVFALAAILALVVSSSKLDGSPQPAE